MIHDKSKLANLTPCDENTKLTPGMVVTLIEDGSRWSFIKVEDDGVLLFRKKDGGGYGRLTEGMSAISRDKL